MDKRENFVRFKVEGKKLGEGKDASTYNIIIKLVAEILHGLIV